MEQQAGARGWPLGASPLLVDSIKLGLAPRSAMATSADLYFSLGLCLLLRPGSAVFPSGEEFRRPLEHLVNMTLEAVVSGP